MTTTRQIETLLAIDTLSLSGRPPTFAELADQLLVSAPVARRHVLALAEQGLVRSGASPRSTVITTAGRETLLLRVEAPAPALPDREYATWRNRYVFPHPRDAIRAWDSHRRGLRVDRARSSRGGGRSPGIEDVLRVGRVLAQLHGPQVQILVSWASHARSSADQRVKALVERVSRQLRQLGLVAGTRGIDPVLRSSWTAADGQQYTTTATLPIPPCGGTENVPT